MHLDERIRVADGAAIVGHNVRDTLGANGDAADLAELELGLLRLDRVDGKAALHVKEQTEVLVGLLNRDHVHEAGGVVRIRANLAVDLDEALHHDHGRLAAGQRILKAVAQEDDQRQRLAALVRTSRGLRGLLVAKVGKCVSVASMRDDRTSTYKGAADLVKHPVLGRMEALQVLLRPARLRADGAACENGTIRPMQGAGVTDAHRTPNTTIESSSTPSTKLKTPAPPTARILAGRASNARSGSRMHAKVRQVLSADGVRLQPSNHPPCPSASVDTAAVLAASGLGASGIHAGTDIHPPNRNGVLARHAYHGRDLCLNEAHEPGSVRKGKMRGCTRHSFERPVRPRIRG